MNINSRREHVEMYAKEGRTDAWIGERLGVKPGTIESFRADHGIPSGRHYRGLKRQQERAARGLSVAGTSRTDPALGDTEIYTRRAKLEKANDKFSAAMGSRRHGRTDPMDGTPFVEPRVEARGGQGRSGLADCAD